MYFNFRSFGQIFLVLVLSCSLSGCLFWQSNEARQIDLSAGPRRGGVIVFGLDTANGQLEASLSRYDPSTGYAGNCDSDDRADADSKTPGVQYWAFEVPPGEYVVNSFFHTTGAFDPTAGPDAFVVPAGRRVYIGTFLRVPDPTKPYHVPSSHLILRRDLDVAKNALGNAGSDLDLAKSLPDFVQPISYMCTP